LGDAHPSVVVETLRCYYGISPENKLSVDVVKLSHHGSKRNTNAELLNHIKSNRFIVSSDGSQGLPDKECLARIIRFAGQKVEFCFNSSIGSKIFKLEDRQAYAFLCTDVSHPDCNYTLEV
jgi:hypothetical protein